MCKSKKNRQLNGQKKKDKITNNDLQNIHIKQKIITKCCMLGSAANVNGILQLRGTRLRRSALRVSVDPHN
jgi:hypothetical protein